MFRVVFIGLILSSLNALAKHQALSLQKAIERKLVKVEAFSLGGYQGFCMRLDFKNLTKDSLMILVEAGRRLNSIDDKNQDILVVKEELVALRSSEAKRVNVKGYCCQASHSSPSKNAKYHINKLADSNLVMVARYLNAGKFESGVEQGAVWAISDNQSTAAITSRNDSLSLPLRKLVATIKGEKLPWYTLISGSYIYPNGIISVFPLLLKGKLEYSTSEDSYITLRILNEKGMPVCLVKSEWLKATAKQDYDLNIPVKGLAKGKYTVELKSTEKELVKKEFEL